MYKALYRAERPEVFSQVIGQEHIVRILKHQLETDTVSHAYLFCGTRGTGKTSTARILAKGVNCLSEGDKPCGTCKNCLAIKDGTFMDVIEIDAASNNGVENIRELRESVKYPPAVGRKKVYIIDEVHMLSTGAFNALLKTLEEPPANVMFILATTDPEKLPQTILSRCMRLDFKRVSEKLLMERMSQICEERGVSISKGALSLLAVNADGSVRDGLSILDQCLSAGDNSLEREQILDFLGTVSVEFFIDLTEKVSLHNAAAALVLLDCAVTEGKDVKQLMKDWMAHYRNLLITKYIKNPEDMLNMSSENVNLLRDQSNRISLEEINNGIMILSKTINDSRYSTQPRILLELAIVTIATGFGVTAAPENGQQFSAKQVIQPQMMAKVPAKKTLVSESVPKNETEINLLKKEKPSKVDNDFDLDQLWMDVFEEGEASKASFNIIRTATSLVGMNDHEFKVIASSELAADYVEKNREALCRIMESKTGHKRVLICKYSDGDDKENNMAETAAKMAEKGTEMFHIDIKVE